MDRPRKFFKRARQQETEFGSPSEFRGGMDLSAVPMHNALHGRQSDPDSGKLVLSMKALERLEQLY